MQIRHFRDLIVWQKAHQMALKIYRATKLFPADERFGLTSQLRRASISVAANIAEGSARRSTKDLCHFLNMSQGSNEEVKCLLLLARDLEYLPSSEMDSLFKLKRNHSVPSGIRKKPQA